MNETKHNSLLTIARLAPVVGFILLALVAGIGIGAHLTLSSSKIGGEQYADIVESKDFLADILPPPLFPIEAMLDVHVLLDNPGRLDEIAGKVAKAHQIFDERVEHWVKQLDVNMVAGEETKSIFKTELIAVFDETWSQIETLILPAVKAGNIAAAEQASLALEKLYGRALAANSRVVDKLLPAIAAAESGAIEQADRNEWLLAAAVIAVCVVLCLAIAFMVTHVVRPLKRLTGVLSSLANDDFSVVIPFVTRPDELGSVARSVEILKANNLAATRAKTEAISSERAMVTQSIGSGLTKLAGKDLTYRISEEMPEAYRKLQDDFNRAMEQLEGVIGMVSASSETINSGTMEISTASDDLSKRTETQAANLEETAAAVAEITTKVKAALINDPVVKAFDVKVESFKGVVQLSGFVATESEKAQAGRVAATVSGVSEIKNNITLK